jgi:hypothetical protein
MPKRSARPKLRTAVPKSATLSIRMHNNTKNLLVACAKKRGASVSSTVEHLLLEVLSNNPNEASRA